MPAGINFDLITGAIGFVFTLMVFSYWWRDNPLFRVAIYAFVGVSAGYAASVALWQVILPRLSAPLAGGGQQGLLLLVLPVALSLLMLLKSVPAVSRLGSIPTAYMVGVAAAVSIAGALIGTMLPLVQATISGTDLTAATAAGGSTVDAVLGSIGRLVSGSIMVVGTVTTLVYFQFGASSGTGRRNPVVGLLALIGQFFIGVTLGALFAGAYAAAVTALIERIHFLITFILSLL